MLEEPAKPRFSVRRRGILVVDDSSTVRELLRKHLQLQGFRVWTGGSGKEALFLCDAHGSEIGLILLSHPTPAMDSLEAWEQLRDLEPEVPVCFLTAELEEQAKHDLRRRGAHHVFSKPVRTEEITCIVRKLLVQGISQEKGT
ncbi:MAG: response regulator [Isosphaeraceae bacterium]